MNLRGLLTSRPTATGWLLEPRFAAIVRRDGKGALHCAHTALPEGVLEGGPVGLQTVDRERLTAHLKPLQDRVGGARRAAVVIPTGWVRSHLLEFDHLPRRAGEQSEVVRWRLKKLLPVQPTELRLSIVSHQLGGHRQILSMAGLERALSELEAAFSALGVEPGLLTSRLFALAAESRQGLRVVVQHEPGFLSLLLDTDSGPRLLRTKPLPPGGDVWSDTTRELHLALSYIRENLSIGEPLGVLVAAGEGALEQALSEWWGAQPGVTVESQPTPVCTELGMDLDAHRLRPLHAVLRGETTA
jgi:hypothetical protein